MRRRSAKPISQYNVEMCIRDSDIIKRSFDAMGSEWSSLQRGVIIEGYVIIAKIVSVLAVAASLYIYHPILCLIVLAAPLPTLYTTYVGNKPVSYTHLMQGLD